MIKRVFSMPWRGLAGFINSVFKLAQLPLSRPHYSYISKQTITINITLKME
ncbi:Mobile element protein [Candidatus Enterovibrio altilux]|uniref:Mobile element protein n=1 Tax=Candidatus Enterovibrio altilux TaxID=1927128 RepID=A0A291BA02_9GAMM|nr:Mobile element protein [Candidatus Enterovibrio luxaltus]